MNRKLQVFISATYKDLEVERRAAVDAILEAKHIPEGMEFFAAESREQMDVIKQKIRESDVLLILLGARYGSIEPDSGRSYTHLEYLYALELKKPVIAMVMKPGAVKAWEKKNVKDIERNTGDKLEEFKTDVTRKRLASFFGNVDELKFAVLKALVIANDNTELVGWVRRDATVDGAEAYKRLTMVEAERDALRSRNQELERQTAEDTSVIPAEAEVKRVFKLKLDDGTIMEGETTFLDWFLRIGRLLTMNAGFETFQSLTERYFKRIAGVDYKERRLWLYREYSAAALRRFELFGWLVIASAVTSAPFEEPETSLTITLTDKGKRLLLAQPATIESIKRPVAMPAETSPINPPSTEVKSVNSESPSSSMPPSESNPSSEIPTGSTDSSGNS